MQKCYGLNFVYILFQPLDREIVFSCIVFRLRFNNVIFIQGKWCGGERAKAVLSTETLSAGLSLPKRKVSGFIFKVVFNNSSMNQNLLNKDYGRDQHI